MGMLSPNKANDAYGMMIANPLAPALAHERASSWMSWRSLVVEGAAPSKILASVSGVKVQAGVEVLFFFLRSSLLMCLYRMAVLYT